MKVIIEICDTIEVHYGAEVPMITMDVKSEESVEGLSEPTPAMWTGSYIYELFTAGMLVQMVKEYIVLKNQQANEQAADANTEADGV
ncbi:MAG: hypothetical protein RIA09_16315 [Hoeflea sp.]|jgi:hypothetical protein|uniref:hypothetical protein n=1 Tax=Hoeflea sp. TaxID=1940281 RepID=UPI0032ED7E4B